MTDQFLMGRWSLVTGTWLLVFFQMSATVPAAELIPSSKSVTPAVTQQSVMPATADNITSPTSNTGRSFADDPFNYLITPFKLSERPMLKQSVFVFGGRTSATDIWSTAVFNLHRPGQLTYDNYIVGAAYQRDFIQLNSGLTFGAEVGLAYRFGHYGLSPIYQDSIAQSAELWGGLGMRYGIDLFQTLRFTPGVVFGLSAISSAIGQEAGGQSDGKNATLLFYLALEGAFALTSHPDTELVLRLHHRSGAYGTLGAMKEGNNASTIGIRQHF